MGTGRQQKIIIERHTATKALGKRPVKTSLGHFIRGQR